MEKIEKYSIKGIPNAKVKFGGSFYKVVSVIFHVGKRSIEHGHYISFVRHNKFWLQVNDDVVERK